MGDKDSINPLVHSLVFVGLVVLGFATMAVTKAIAFLVAGTLVAVVVDRSVLGFMV